PGVRIIGKLTGFELEFHSGFWILDSEFPQNASFAIGSMDIQFSSGIESLDHVPGGIRQGEYSFCC
ncbi:MAG: hypothetical protein WCI51_11485, partial [Lentisphaerota bacterium]